MKQSRGLEITASGAALGARVTGVRLADPLTHDQLAAIRRAAAEYGVLVFPGQHLDDDAQIGFARQLGTPSVHPVEAFAGHGNLLQELLDDADHAPVNDSWHTDVTYLASPPRYAILRALLVPESGGDTEWAHMGAAYSALPAALERSIRNATGLHDARFEMNMKLRGLGNDTIIAKLEEAFPTVRHPVVLEHPITSGKVLYVNSAFTIGLEGVDGADANALLEKLLARVEDPMIHFRHQWSAGDVVLWDEITTQHRALADHYPAERVMRRVTVDGDALAGI
jgi:taurine dioxygenase